MKKISCIFVVVIVCVLTNGLMSCEKLDNDSYTNTSISYMITMSPDLLKFVYPEVTYVDAGGNLHKISGVQELDRLVIENKAATKHFGVWTTQTIKGTKYKCWTLNMTFDNRPFYSYLGVNYKKLDIAEDTTGVVYDFHHSIFSTNILVTSKATTKVKYDWVLWGLHPKTSTEGSAHVENHITFTNDSKYNGSEVEQYINDLVNTPDKMGFYIDSNGTFTEKDDFPL